MPLEVSLAYVKTNKGSYYSTSLLSMSTPTLSTFYPLVTVNYIYIIYKIIYALYIIYIYKYFRIEKNYNIWVSNV